MAVGLMMEVLWGGGPVASLRMSVRFRRPMFWDEALEIYRRTVPGQDWPDAIVVVRPDGKLANDAEVTALGRG